MFYVYIYTIYMYDQDIYITTYDQASSQVCNKCIEILFAVYLGT